ncbi:MAG: IclR family transcriptional regulator, partial [Candidatus Binatia bacterium]
TVHRLLMVLERHRLVEKIPHSGRYGLGLKLFELGTRAVAQLGLGQRARPYLERLVAEVRETAHLCVLDEGEVLYLEKVEPSRTVRVPSSVGRRNPAHCTAVGKVLLAFLPPAELDAVVRRHALRAFTRNTITSLSALRRELDAVRERGYSVDNEEIEEGLVCVGAPVRDYSGSVVASISIAGPAFRLTKAKIPAVAAKVTRGAGEFSTALGHRDMERLVSVRRRSRPAAG